MGFRFKQFTLDDAACQMKIGTDSVLLGAWITKQAIDPQAILDIGTGCGVIAMMLAQHFSCQIDAIEIDPQAYHQAMTNFRHSRWAERLHAIPGDFNAYQQETERRYDLIVSNPPYFSAGVKPEALPRCIARHQESLDFHSLIEGVARVMSANGRFFVIVPASERQSLIAKAMPSGLYCCSALMVRPHEAQPANRVILEFGRTNQATRCSALAIRSDNSKTYTDAYRLLTKAYYLSF